MAAFPGAKFFSTMDAKSRVFLIIAILVVIGIAGYMLARYLGGGPTVGASQVAAVPSGLQSVPGGKLTSEYYRALMQANVQSTQQAQITGGSAVPTLVNVPGQTTDFSQNCTVLCPGDDGANVSDDINNLIKQGKLSQTDANNLLDLAKQNVPVNEYAAALDALVKAGKLTPEQARLLLTKYKKQHDNALANQSAQVMDALVKSGQLPLQVANELLALQKSHVTPADYADALNQLVREGKISPQTAAQLLAQYTQQHAQEAARESAFGLRQLAKTGAITPEVAADLAALQNKNVPVDQYAAELQRLVNSGKLTPAVASKLLADYRAQHLSVGPAGVLSSMLGAQEANAAAQVNDLVANKKLSAAGAATLLDLQRKNVPLTDYQNALNQLVKEGKLSAADAQQLAGSYQHLSGLRAEASQLTQMQSNNVPVSQYADELKKAVQAGYLSPDDAANLLQSYQAMSAPVSGGVDTALPGTSDFANLQQRLQAQQTQPAGPPGTPSETTAQFDAAALQAQEQAEAAAAEERARRIAQIQSGMSAQAQSLLAAWQPPRMEHRSGSYTIEKTTTTVTDTKSGTGVGKDGEILKRPLIKTGTILFAVLDTAVDSDYPDTPVMATIVQGPFKGAKLIGKLALAKGQDRVSLNFTIMDRDDWIKSKTVSAFAIDPDTARTVMATDVNHHYMTRYGAIFATSFISGYASAIQQEGTSTTGIFGTSTSTPALSPGNKLAVAVGQIGKNLNTTVQTYVNTPTTVKVNAGVGLGILFMSEVT